MKNFGVIYSKPDAGDVRLAPVYDVCCTVVYIPGDVPALTTGGRKVWLSREKMLEFGVIACGLSLQEAKNAYGECVDAVCWLIDELDSMLRDKAAPDEKAYRILEEMRRRIALGLGSCGKAD